MTEDLVSIAKAMPLNGQNSYKSRKIALVDDASKRPMSALQTKHKPLASRWRNKNQRGPESHHCKVVQRRHHLIERGYEAAHSERMTMMTKDDSLVRCAKKMLNSF